MFINGNLRSSHCLYIYSVQSSSALPVVTNELDIVSRMARFDAIYTDGVAVSRIACLAPEKGKDEMIGHYNF